MHWKLSRNWLVVLVVVGLVVVGLELPATIGGKMYGIVGITFAGLLVLISAGVLLRRI